MFILALVEWCAIIAICTFVITQLIVPAIRNKPTFPLFRKTIQEKDEVEEELRNEHVFLETEQLKNEVEEVRKEKDKLSRKRTELQ